MHSFRDSVVIVTGTSSGIGRAIALELARDGARLVLSARGADALESVAEECRVSGGDAVSVAADVGERSDCERLVRRAVESFGRIDMLVNNAGISMRTRFDEITDPDLVERIMRVNFLGSAWCTFYALPELKKSRGRIVAVSSLTGKTGVPMRTGYAASKHAMAGFFDSLRLELTGDGVSVTTVYPGFVTSEIRYRALGADGQPLHDDAQNRGGDMPAEECARITLRAAAKRRREVVMTAQGKIGLWVKLVAPRLVDAMAVRAIRGRGGK
jgi:NAD(P)-dependent dehydrogenase (short-subunit alcohol dehydrogenase family)